ncbi:MAG: hypothetical protein TECD_01077 [Hyphomicrobiaceae bacterium hypho_1]
MLAGAGQDDRGHQHASRQRLRRDPHGSRPYLAHGAVGRDGGAPRAVVSCVLAVTLTCWPFTSRACVGEAQPSLHSSEASLLFHVSIRLSYPGGLRRDCYRIETRL